jgi:type IV fimbrial biogenesis protein FimT
LTGAENSARKEAARPRDACAPRRAHGFTTLELLTTLAVAAVVMSIGVPSLLGFVHENRISATTNELVAAVNLARAEAARRNAPVVVCASVDGRHCTASAAWPSGWIVGTESGELIRAWQQPDGDPATISASVTQLVFQPRGTLAEPATLSLRMPNCVGTQGRDIAVAKTGRVAVARVDC